MVSEWEFKKAIEAGIPAEKIVFSGIGKNENEIRYAIANNCFQINVESLAELKKINQIAKGLGKVQNIGIRINPDVQSDTHEKITTGSLENKFGISVNETLEIFNKTNEFSSLSITAIAFHIGSNIKDLSPFKNSFEVAFKIIKSGVTTKLINGPVSKKNFLNKKFLGLTEYIADKFLIKKNAMLIYNKNLSVCPVTTHLPLKLVSRNINKKIIVNYKDGPFEYLDNYWIFKDDKNGCEVEFMVDFKFKSVFLQTLMETLFSEAVKKMVRAFEKRANELYN